MQVEQFCTTAKQAAPGIGPHQQPVHTLGPASIKGRLEGRACGIADLAQQHEQHALARMSSANDYERVCDGAHAVELWDSDCGEFFTAQARTAKRASSRYRADEPYADDLPTVWFDARPAAIEAALDSIRAVHGQH
ncbi:MAG: hypothetical protein RR365_07135 [Bacteroides sp.]